ncbi:MAG: hypothetical protein ISR65_00095 [Bacteriovoracaceae bacterium]|nr:hypothetical protein [Bacteriovoracaceae bacterium]
MNSNHELFSYLKELSDNNQNLKEIEASAWQKFGMECSCLVLDSTGFTRTSKQQGIVYFLILIAKMRELVLDILKKHNCISYRFEADNAYAEFPTSTHALNASTSIHQAINKLAIKLNTNEEYKVCIGIGFGKVLNAGHEGVYGEQMNLASKLGKDLAEGDQTLLTESAYLSLSTNEQNKKNFTKKEIILSKTPITYYEM